MAQVVGIPDEVDGERPMGIVILKKNCPNTTAKEIEKFMEDRVEYMNYLTGGVKFVSGFPRTPSGKIDRKTLKRMAIEGRL